MNEIENLRRIESLEAELKRTQLAYQMAAQMSQFKAGFLARTSHELRSPLSSLIGLHQLILSDLCESPEEQKEFLTQAYNSAMKLMALIDEIVAVSKTEYGTKQLKIESLRLADLFQEVHNLTHLQAANRNLRLKVVTPDDTIYVDADRSRLIQSMTNAIDSGIAMMKEGRIQLIAIEEAEAIKIEINFDCAAQLWQEETNFKEPLIDRDLDRIRDLVQKINLSPSMRLLLSQTLLETMGGSLQLLDSSVDGSSKKTTQMILTCNKAKL
jgi:signal transduction histidine kinase